MFCWVSEPSFSEGFRNRAKSPRSAGIASARQTKQSYVGFDDVRSSERIGSCRQADKASVGGRSPLPPECGLFGVMAVHHQYGHRQPS
jgi:hypothetical protein